MVASTLILVLLLALGLGAVLGTGCVVRRLDPKPRVDWGLSVEWLAKGILMPMLIWGMINLGAVSSLQPFMPEIQLARARGQSWFAPWLRVMGQGCFVVCTYWAAVTLSWQLAKVAETLSAGTREAFKSLCWSCFLGLLLPAALLVFIGGWPNLGLAGLIVFFPLAWYAPGVLYPPKAPPLYARAIARMKFGKYNEAEIEIINELEKSEDDFEGWMMLAELYATHFRDLSQATDTVRDICGQPDVTPSQISIALHRLADWQLRLGGDPAAARQTLGVISKRLPGTHLAHMAELRVAQLPQTAREWREQQAAPPIPLPALGDYLDKPDSGMDGAMDRAAAARLANELSDQLKGEPNHVLARERFARLLAVQLGRADLGLEQLALLLEMTDQPIAKRAEWLGLVAAWQIRYLRNFEVGKNVLEQLIREYPATVQAFAARRRLSLLQTKMRQVTSPPSV